VTIQLQPCLTVGKIIFAWVLREDCLKRSDDLSCVFPGVAVTARHEDHAEVAGPAGRYRLLVQRAEVAHVFGDEGPVLGTRKGQDSWI
jgi:hypothetical protein